MALEIENTSVKKKHLFNLFHRLIPACLRFFSTISPQRLLKFNHFFFFMTPRSHRFQCIHADPINHFRHHSIGTTRPTHSLNNNNIKTPQKFQNQPSEKMRSFMCPFTMSLRPLLTYSVPHTSSQQLPRVVLNIRQYLSIVSLHFNYTTHSLQSYLI